MKTNVRSLVVLAGALALAACGGSSSSDGGTTPPPPGNVTRDMRGAITAVNPTAHTVTVNNKTVAVQGAAIVDDTVTVGEDRLTVGTVVAVRGDFSGDDRTGTAAHVEIEHGVEGTVDDKGTDFIRVAGQRVNVDDSTHFEDARRLGGIVNGTKVRVSGVPDDFGGLRASRVDDSPRADGGDDVKGFVSGLSGKTFQLRLSPDATSCWSVDASGIATLPAGVANGAFVEVHTTATRGAGTGGCTLGNLVASSIHVEDRFSQSEVEVEGIVTSGNSSDFVVDGTSVHTTTTTTWQLGAPGDLVVGAKVEAEGSLSTDGVLQARKVSFRPGARLTAIVDSVQADSITVLGMRVQMTSFTRRDVTPVAGNRIEVRGNPSADGTGLVAYRLTDPGGNNTDERVLLRALVSEKTSGASPTATLMGFVVTPTAGASYRGISTVSGQDGPPISATEFWNQVEAGHTVIKVRARTAADVSVAGHTFSAEELELEGNDG